MRDNGKFYKRDSEAECPNLRAGRSGYGLLAGEPEFLGAILVVP
jgi:hypothetical protein